VTVRRLGLTASAIAATAWLIAARRSGTVRWPRDPAKLMVQPEDRAREPFSARKRLITAGDRMVAYVDEGSGEPLVLLHGCPFHAYEWRDVIPILAQRFRVIAPDLVGLGDTPVSLADDYRLPRNAEMVCDLLDALGLDSAHFVGHDHGGATCLLLMGSAPERMCSVVLTNAEAYDDWPSAEETPFLHLIVRTPTSPMLWGLMHSPSFRRWAFSIAAHRREVLTDETLRAIVAPLIATPARWQRLRRFFAWQLDPDHQSETVRAVEGMRRFTAPTLLLWGRHDENFGEPVARKLLDDIPGAERIEWMGESGHLPMLEQPDAYAAAVGNFAAAAPSSPAIAVTG
jgi:pimeloyl-ACP methyl ester carboxylesterase